MLLFIDTETTGEVQFKLPSSHELQPDIMQFGAVLANSERRIFHRVEFLVRPEPWWNIDPEAVEIHGITAEMCAAYGLPGRVVLNCFNMMCKRADLVIAHNVQFDAKVMRTACQRLGITCELDSRERPVSTFCTMQKSTSILKLPKDNGRGHKWPKLKEAHQYFLGCGFDNAHSALADVEACAAIYWKLQEALQCGQQSFNALQTN